ncbi:MAG: T9SS type A sorting domain-containing protein [Candidatus Cloacimonetes bacterium]|nr:T9SS type A sorting domain-containing protein [Candidatus Cloacimonadota bacterium]
MKRIALFLVLVLSIGLHSYVCWEENGIAIRQESNLNYSGSVINLNGGGYMMLWSDASGGLQEMKVQKVSADGENVWEEPVILTTRECYYPNGESLVESYNGEIIAAWYELGNPGLLRLQKIDDEGNLLWGESGLIIELEWEANNCFDFDMISDGAGAVYLIWLKEEGQNEIKVLYVNADGEVPAGWDSSGLDIFSDNSYPQTFSAEPDGYGGIILAVRFSMEDIHLQRCDNQANLHWGIEGITMPGLVAEYKMSLLPWGVGEYAIIVEQNDGFWANTIDYTGNFGFSEMQLIAPVENESDYKMLRGIKTSDGKLGMIWNEEDGELNYIHTQKTEMGEEPDWGEDGILLGTSEDDYVVNMAVVADESGGLILSWSELEGDTYNILYQHLDSAGNAVNEVEPQLMGSSYHYWHSLRMFRDSLNSIMFWQQHKEDKNELALQIFDSAETPQLAEQDNIIWDVLAGTTHSPYLLKAKGSISAISWRDERYPQSQIYLQVINNETGDLWYESNGIAVTSQSELEENDENFCISDNCERLCVTCGVLSDMYYLGGVQILDQDGNRLLGDDGMTFNAEANLIDNAICSTGENEFLIVWTETDGDFMNPAWYLKAQKIVDDQFVWGNGITIVDNPENEVSDINIQYPYISWIDWDFPAGDLKLVKISDDGSIAPGWNTDGLIVTNDYRNNTSQICKNDSGMYIFWLEIIDQNTYQVRGQNYSSDGEILWEEGGRIFGDQCDDLYEYHFAGEYLYSLVYEDENPCILYKYDLDGEFVWENGITFENFAALYISNFSVWENALIVYGTSESNDIYAIIYDIDGNIVENLPPEGLQVCTQQHAQSFKACATDENGSNIVLWKDERGEFAPYTDPSLYVQKIDLTSVPITDEEIPDGNLVNMTNYPNPFSRSTTLKCDLPRGIEDAEIVIYNIKGQKVRSIPATSNEVEWDCRNQDGNLAGSGVYFYVLQGKNIKSETGKMIMLR